MSMIIKVPDGEGAWSIFEVEKDLRYTTTVIAFGPDDRLVTFEDFDDPDRHLGREEIDRGATWFEDERFPSAIESTTVHEVAARGKVVDDRVWVRWVSWSDAEDYSHMLVTGSPVYICNDQGDTIEALR